MAPEHRSQENGKGLVPLSGSYIKPYITALNQDLYNKLFDL